MEELRGIEVYVFAVGTTGISGKAARGKAVSEACRSFVKRKISSMTGVGEAALKFSAGEKGKPYIEGSRVKFSLSHSGGVCAAAFSPEEVGADIELVRPLSRRVAERFFTLGEREYLAGAGGEDEQIARFFEIWTAKEAFLKLHGVGLSAGLGFDTADREGLLERVSSEGLATAFLCSRRVSLPLKEGMTENCLLSVCSFTECHISVTVLSQNHQI